MSVLKKTNFTKLLLVIGAILIGIFIFLSLIGTDAEHFFYENDVTEIKSINGVVYTDAIASTYRTNDNLSLVWKTKGDHYLYDSDYPYSCEGDTCWSAPRHLTAGLTYGVTAVNIDTSLACFFIKNGENGRNTGSIYYQCLDLNKNIFVTSPTAFNIENENLSLDKVIGVLSTTESLTPSKFYATVSNQDLTSEVHVFECTITSSTVNLNQSCVLTNTIKSSQDYKDPSIVVVPTATGEAHYTFFRNSADSDNIHYTPSSDPTKIILMENTSDNGKNNPRATNNRPATAYFNGEVYVAWKNANNNSIRFAKIDATDTGLFNADHGRKKWTYCEFNESNGNPIAKSNTGPTLFEYDNGLFVLWSNENQGKLVYYRIDDITSTNEWENICK